MLLQNFLQNMHIFLFYQETFTFKYLKISSLFCLQCQAQARQTDTHFSKSCSILNRIHQKIVRDSTLIIRFKSMFIVLYDVSQASRPQVSKLRNQLWKILESTGAQAPFSLYFYYYNFFFTISYWSEFSILEKTLNWSVPLIN